jgi:hypothetical protein
VGVNLLGNGMRTNVPAAKNFNKDIPVTTNRITEITVRHANLYLGRVTVMKREFIREFEE